MGKKAKEHRAKVAKRNRKVEQAKYSMQNALNKMMEQMAICGAATTATREESSWLSSSSSLLQLMQRILTRSIVKTDVFHLFLH